MDTGVVVVASEGEGASGDRWNAGTSSLPGSMKAPGESGPSEGGGAGVPNSRLGIANDCGRDWGPRPAPGGDGTSGTGTTGEGETC